MIEVVQTGPLNTVQDLGRPGFRAIGVSASGAMDPLAVRIGNALLGNEDGAAAIEVQTFPFTIRVAAAADVAITGTDGECLLNGRVAITWCTHRLFPGDILEIRQPRKAGRAYITVHGGLDVPVVMGSRSTTLRGGFGGNDGRPLATGDRLAIALVDDSRPHRPLGAVEPSGALKDFFPAAIGDILPVRAIPAGEHELFSIDADRFWSQPWKISPQSDRTGYRLSGDPIHPERPVEMRSHGVVPGVV